MKGEVIPNGEFLYRYAKPEAFPIGQSVVPVGIFIDNELSCDWEKYQKRPGKSFHIKQGRSVIIRINVCEEIRRPCNPRQPKQPQPQWEQEIIHSPIKKGEDINNPKIANFSHSLIKGLKRQHIVRAIADNSIRFLDVDINQNTPILLSIRNNYLKIIIYSLLAIALTTIVLFLILHR